eukprot:6182789-Karenia_brevis.AAC.1
MAQSLQSPPTTSTSTAQWGMEGELCTWAMAIRISQSAPTASNCLYRRWGSEQSSSEGSIRFAESRDRLSQRTHRCLR